MPFIQWHRWDTEDIVALPFLQPQAIRERASEHQLPECAESLLSGLGPSHHGCPRWHLCQTAYPLFGRHLPREGCLVTSLVGFLCLLSLSSLRKFTHMSLLFFSGEFLGIISLFCFSPVPVGDSQRALRLLLLLQTLSKVSPHWVPHFHIHMMPPGFGTQKNLCPSPALPS